MEKTQLLTILIGAILVLTVINLYATFNLQSKINSVSGMSVAEQKVPSDDAQQQQIVQMSAGDSPVKGSKDAPVTIIEFSDFQCPYCERFYSQSLPLIEENYIKTGKAKIVFKQFPLSFHQYAQKAAEASECANEQNKFWEYHNKLFENQQALDTASLKKYAADLSLDTKKFNECLDSGKMASKVQSDLNEGAKSGISGTPSFIINGKVLVGAQPFEAFKQVIDEELSK